MEDDHVYIYIYIYIYIWPSTTDRRSFNKNNSRENLMFEIWRLFAELYENYYRVNTRVNFLFNFGVTDKPSLKAELHIFFR